MGQNPTVSFQDVTFRYQETDRDVFRELDLTLPHGVLSFVGQNGTGKSTLLLLSGGRVLPQAGTVTLLGKDTKELQAADETEKNRYASFIYQNMEFETEEPIGDLIDFVYENGFYNTFDPDFKKELIEVLELESFLNKKTQEISKGQLQRTIIAFSLLYGSKTILMDEPVFALEDYQKERVMGFLTDYAREYNIPVLYSAHELDLTKKYSDYIVLFYKDGTITVGKTEDLYTPDSIEKVYETPFSMLKLKESMFRSDLLTISKAARNELND
jgi:ABC-type cobalamin/Fe3+-siderophores transport system ATPase subunit